MKTAVVLLGAMLALAACAGSGTPAARKSPSSPPGAGSAPAPLVAVLERPGGPQANTVALVDMNGVLRATADFQARQLPFVGNAMPMLQKEVQIGVAGVYYVDGYGVVRLLEPSGRTSVVASFGVTPEQHEIWYAVSPDGKQVIAGVLTPPAVHQTEPLPTLSGRWQFDLELATAGGTTRVLNHVESPTGPDAPGAGWQAIFPVGWTHDGPVAMVGAPIATQNLWVGGPLFVLDAAGKPTQRVGGNDAFAASILPSGVLAAASADGNVVTVRKADGTVLWKPSLTSFDARQLSLSPDADAVANGQAAATRTGSFPVPGHFYTQGWADAQTLFGRPYLDETTGSLEYIRLADPAAVHSLGIDGDFAGVWTGK